MEHEFHPDDLGGRTSEPRAGAMPSTRSRRRFDPLSALLILMGLGVIGGAISVIGDRAALEVAQLARFERIAESQQIAPAPNELPRAPGPDDEDRPPDFIVTTPARLAVAAAPGVRRADPPARRQSPGLAPAPESPPPIQSPPPNMPNPTRIAIPRVGVDADVVEVAARVVEIDGQKVSNWRVADWAAGRHNTSARPGEQGNIVIAGHSDVRGEVFRGLHDIDIGDEINLTSAAGVFVYIVEEIHLRRDRDVPLAERLAVGGFFAPMPEERLTLVTCWPYGVDDHRLIVVAKPPANPDGDGP